MREAARTGLGELIEVKEEVSEVSKTNPKSPEIIKLGAVWKKLNEVLDAALKTEKLVQLSQNAWKVLSEVREGLWVSD
jgi:hypothetical protein